MLHLVVGDGARRNALGEADWAALTGRVRAATAPDSGLRALVLSGHVGSLSAGSDMHEWAEADRTAVVGTVAVMEDCFRALEDSRLPVVAAVEGVAAGAGCQLALAGDLVVMGASARIGMPVARLGILASPAFAARVAARVGAALAADLYLTARPPEAVAAAKTALHAVSPPERHLGVGTTEGPPTRASVAPIPFRDAVRRFLAPATRSA